VAALRSAGDAASTDACRAHADEACGSLQAANGLRDCARRSAATACALRGALHVCVRWAAVSGELLPPEAAVLAASQPLQSVCSTVVDAVLEMQDLGADDCAALASVLDAELREASAHAAGGAWEGAAGGGAPAWRRLQQLRELLEAPLRSFAAPGAFDAFERRELAGLVRALFEGSPLRAEVLRALECA
jgi:hypothetical protein